MRASAAFVLALVTPFASGIRIVLSNDDGWATSSTRGLFDLMNQTHDVVLSAPADNKSGHGSKKKTPTVRVKPCQFDTCPAYSEPYGHDEENPRLHWVNSYAATAMQWGVETFGPAFWDGQRPELAVSGINAGINVWLSTPFSSTIAAASWAVNNHDIPGIAFSGWYKEARPYFDEPQQENIVYPILAMRVIDEVIKGGKPYLPDGIFLNVNFPKVAKECQHPNQFRYIMTRINPTFMYPVIEDYCGSSERLPREYNVLDLHWGSSMPCTVSISVGDSGDKTTTNDPKKMRAVMDKLSDLVECPIDEWWEAPHWKWDWRDHIGVRRYASNECYHIQGDDPQQECLMAKSLAQVYENKEVSK